MSNDKERYVVIDTNVVEKAGANAAILYSKLCEWHSMNKELGFERYDFSSIKNIQTLIPCFTFDQIRFALKKLKEIGFVECDPQKKQKLTLTCNALDFSQTLWDFSQFLKVKEKSSPHTPYKKKYKEEYILSSESDNKLSSSSDNNIQNFNNFFPPFIPQVPAEPSQKEKKEVLQTQKKDVFEEFFTNTIYRDGVIKNYGVDEKTLDYCINQARKKSSCMIDGVTRREAQFKVKYELDNIPVVKGKLFDRKQAFYNEILNCANQQNLDRDFATWFYCKWSHLAIPELEIMMFEKEAKDRSWDTFRMLKMSYLSYKRKNEKYY